MVRATRSTAALQNQHNAPAEPSQTLPKRGGRKRKRVSTSTDMMEDQPASKQQRRVEVKLDEENSQPGVADLPLDSGDAQKILDILEMIDTQGLLDRVFPSLDGDSSSSSKASTSKDTIKHHSLRSLLQDPESHPLRVVRSAIYPLFPISSHPRSRPSIPAAQQLHFCNLALSLLDQSSQAHPRISLSQASIFPSGEESDFTGEPSERQRRYALVQKLPEGEWWSSSNSIREGENGLSVSEVKDLRRGYAELASVIPTLPLQPSSMSTLGELQMENRKDSRFRFRPLSIHPRMLASGSFLDYGPYTSFAPFFDSEGAEVGQHGLTEIFRGKLQHKKLKELRKKVWAKLQQERDEEEQQMYAEDDTDRPVEEKSTEMYEILESIFPAEKSNGFKDVLRVIEVEEGVSELLKRNSRALDRLNTLQFTRLRGGFTPVKEDTEEWQLAQTIMQSLILLSSLRPRLSGADDEHAPLIPPPSVLRTLRSNLPLAPSQGWQGTLDETRKTALRDDTTVRVEGTVAHASTQQAATVQPVPAAYTPSPLYAYRPPSNAYAYQPPAQARQTNQTPTIVQNNYYQTPYQAVGASQYQYYSQWYNYQAAAGQKNTPTPGLYGNYATAVTPRPVGNTAKHQQVQQNGWPQGYITSAATVLPAHLRRTAAPTTPGTPAYSPYHAYIPTQPT